MNLIKSQAGLIRELLDSTTNVGIIIGENQNVDSVGASLALFLILAGEGKNVQIVSKKEPIVEVSNLFGVNKISKSFQGSTKILTISVPYREGEIEKVSYNIEGTRLNVNLFAEDAGINFSEQDVEYIKKGASPQLIVTIGVGSEQELASFVDSAPVKTIHIDRSPTNVLVGDVTLIDPSFSSISEIIAEMVRELSLGFNPDAFQNLMDGITYATRNFTHPATSAFAFEAAGFLLQNGAKRSDRASSDGDRLRDASRDSRGDVSNRNRNQQPRRDDRRDDRSRNFPRVDQLLNQQPPRVQSSNQGSNQPNPLNQIPRPFPNPKQTPREMLDRDMPDEVIDTPFVEGTRPELVEGSLPENVPDDWFLPKVFKGSKKGN